MRKKWRTV